MTSAVSGRRPARTGGGISSSLSPLVLCICCISFHAFFFEEEEEELLWFLTVHLWSQVDFNQFKDALILILSSTLEPPQAEPESEAGKLHTPADAERPVQSVSLREVATARKSTHSHAAKKRRTKDDYDAKVSFWVAAGSFYGKS